MTCVESDDLGLMIAHLQAGGTITGEAALSLALDLAGAQMDAQRASRVRTLHAPQDDTYYGQQVCRECSTYDSDGNPMPWPCPTIEALDGSL